MKSYELVIQLRDGFSNNFNNFKKLSELAKSSVSNLNNSIKILSSTASSSFGSARSAVANFSNSVRSSVLSVTSLHGAIFAMGNGAKMGLQGIGNAMSSFSSSVASAISSVFSLRNALVLAAGASAFGLSAIKTTAEIQGMQNAIKFASGSAVEGANNLKFIRDSSYELGFDLKATTEGFKTFAGAMMGSKFQGEEVRNMFKQVSYGAAVMGLSADDTKASFLALGQMMGKGKVSAEELRGQLGERIPGAFQIAARSMNVTTAQLDKMLQDGKIMSEDFLPKFAKEMEKTFKSGADAAKNSLGANIARLKNDFTELQLWFGTTFEKSVVAGIGALRNFIAGIKTFAENFSIISDAFAPLNQALLEVRTDLEKAGISFNLFGKSTSSVVGFMEGIAQVIRMALPYILPLVERIPLVVQAFRPIFESLYSLGTTIVANLQMLYPKILSVVDTILQYVAPVVSEAIAYLAPVFSWIVNSLGYFLSAAIDFITPIIKLISYLGTAIVRLVGPLVYVAGYVATGFFDAFSWVLEKIGWLIGKVTDSIDWLMQKLGLASQQASKLGAETNKITEKQGKRDELVKLGTFGKSFDNTNAEEIARGFKTESTGSKLGVKALNASTAQPAQTKDTSTQMANNITGGGAKQTHIIINIGKQIGIENVNTSQANGLDLDNVSKEVLKHLTRAINGAQYAVDTQ